MKILLYKAVVIVLSVVLLYVLVIAAGYYHMVGERPQLPDDERHAYELQVCALQEELGYPSCFVDGEAVRFGSVPGESGVGVP